MTAAAVSQEPSPTPTPAGLLVGVWARVLRVPLLLKLLGANLIIVLAAVAEQYLVPGTSLVLPLLLMLLASFAATATLVWVALRPLAQLEATADRVSDGDFGARVPHSLLADASVHRLSETMNRLLDRVEADRARIQYLAGRAVRARDIERESVARELRDSMAQQVAGIALGLASVRNVNKNAGVEQKLDDTRRLVDDLMDNLRGVAEALYPGTISEFGLGNALSSLGRLMERRTGISVDVETESFPKSLPTQTAAALYRVADEALRNVAQHSQARHVNVRLIAGDDDVRLEIVDDGRGFDLRSVDPLQAGLGLFSAKTVLALAGGELQISGAPGRGTLIVARVPRQATTPRQWQATSSG